MPALAIETTGLTKRYGRHEVVQSLDLRVPAGSIFALVGPNGAGKTTTIKMLMNLVKPTRGRAIIAGADSQRLTSRDFQRIGYVSENQHLPDWMTARELLGYCCPFYPSWDDGLAERVVGSVALPADVPIATLSRGGRMKAALLVALAFRPDVLVLDEPFSGLDPLVREQLAQTLLALAAERPFTIFVSSHDLDEIERVATDVAFIDAGRVLLSESVTALLDRFRRPDGLRPSLREVFLALATTSTSVGNGGGAA